MALRIRFTLETIDGTKHEVVNNNTGEVLVSKELKELIRVIWYSHLDPKGEYRLIFRKVNRMGLAMKL